MTHRWKQFSCARVSPCQKLPLLCVLVPQTSFNCFGSFRQHTCREVVAGCPLPDWSWWKSSLWSSQGGFSLLQATLHAPAAYISLLHCSKSLSHGHSPSPSEAAKEALVCSRQLYMLQLLTSACCIVPSPFRTAILHHLLFFPPASWP